MFTVDKVGRQELYRFLATSEALRPSTRHRYFREVRCFFNWLVDDGVLEESPFRGLKNVRIPPTLIPPFSPREIQSLLDACRIEMPLAARNRAIVLTLLDTGLRCSELIDLGLDDVDLIRRRVRVQRGKGGKPRVVPFASRCARALMTYSQGRGDAPGPFFLSARSTEAGEPRALTASGLATLLKRLGRRAGVEKVHAHRFRHTFATWAIQNDAREIDVQHLLGHNSVEMVRRYSATYRSEQAAERHERFSPADLMLADPD